jgi:hypothetical protein
MQTLNFTTTIQAPKEKLWQVLWDDATYRQWTNVFCEGSYAQTDNWKEGTKVLFLSPGGSGLVSTVAANRPNEFMSFKHLGEVKDGVEDTTSDRVKVWAGSFENYTLKEINGATEILVTIDITDDFKDYFLNIWPKALEALKNIAEAK